MLQVRFSPKNALHQVLLSYVNVLGTTDITQHVTYKSDGILMKFPFNMCM